MGVYHKSVHIYLLTYRNGRSGWSVVVVVVFARARAKSNDLGAQPCISTSNFTVVAATGVEAAAAAAVGLVNKRRRHGRWLVVVCMHDVLDDEMNARMTAHHNPYHLLLCYQRFTAQRIDQKAHEYAKP